MEEKDKIKKNGLLFMESNLTNTLLLGGLDSLKSASLLDVGNYYRAFFQLSIGLERLLKLIYIYDYRNKYKGKFPTDKELRKKGHAINEMVEEYAPKILENNIYSLVIDFITDFNKTSRYYNLYALSGIIDANPIETWGSIEVLILKKYKGDISEELKEQTEFLKSMMDFDYRLNDGTKIENISPILTEYAVKEYAQEYNVLVYYEIIKELVNKLVECHGEYNYPDMKEIFKSFYINMEEGEIRQKDKWIKTEYQEDIFL